MDYNDTVYCPYCGGLQEIGDLCFMDYADCYKTLECTFCNKVYEVTAEVSYEWVSQETIQPEKEPIEEDIPGQLFLF